MTVEPFARRLRRAYTECSEWRERVFARIRSVDPDFVVLSNSSNNALSGSGDELRVERSRWERAAAKTYRRLREMRVPVVLIRDTPWPSFDVPSCLSRAAWKSLDRGRHCRFDGVSGEREAVFEIERRELESAGGGIAVDMTEEICRSGMGCAVERDGSVIYHDAHHLTSEFSRSLADPLFEKIEELARGGLG